MKTRKIKLVLEDQRNLYKTLKVSKVTNSIEWGIGASLDLATVKTILETRDDVEIEIIPVK